MTLKTSDEGMGLVVGWRLKNNNSGEYPTLDLDVQYGVGVKSRVHPVVKEPCIHYGGIQVHQPDTLIFILAQCLLLGIPGEVGYSWEREEEAAIEQRLREEALIAEQRAELKRQQIQKLMSQPMKDLSREERMLLWDEGCWDGEN